jgi:hypothetical protein
MKNSGSACSSMVFIFPAYPDLSGTFGVASASLGGLLRTNSVLLGFIRMPHWSERSPRPNGIRRAIIVGGILLCIVLSIMGAIFLHGAGLLR